MNSRDKTIHFSPLKPRQSWRTPLANNNPLLSKKTPRDKNSKLKAGTTGDASAKGDFCSFNLKGSEGIAKPSTSFNNLQPKRSSSVKLPERIKELTPFKEIPGESHCQHVSRGKEHQTFKLRPGSARSDTLLDDIINFRSYIPVPIEARGSGGGGESGCAMAGIDDSVLEKSESYFSLPPDEEDENCCLKISDKYLPRSVSPCLTDPNSIALVDVSPPASLACELNEDGSESNCSNSSNSKNIEFIEDDPLLACWDDEEDFLIHPPAKDKAKAIRLEKSEIEQIVKAFCKDKGLSAANEQYDNEDNFYSCYDSDTDESKSGDRINDLDKMPLLNNNINNNNNNNSQNSSYKSKDEINNVATLLRSTMYLPVDKNICKDETSAETNPLMALRPGTPWPPKSFEEEENVLKKSRKLLKTTLKTIFVSVVAIAVAVYFPWYNY